MKIATIYKCEESRPKAGASSKEKACLIMGAPPPHPYGHSSPCKARVILAFSRKNVINLFGLPNREKYEKKAIKAITGVKQYPPSERVDTEFLTFNKEVSYVLLPV